MRVPESGGKNVGSCGSSGIYKPATHGCKVTDIITGWVCAIVS